jgi:octanoyl-[GcvH]:protein N-octanoyltransferase
MDLLTTAHPERPELDMRLSGELLDAVAAGEAPDTVRVYRPGPTVAFGRLDQRRPGFAAAGRVAAAHGRAVVVRWGGGHAAAYDADSLIIEILRRHDRGAVGLEPRFIEMAELITDALASVGVPLVLGELAGEYCPGQFSLHLPDGPKVAGVAQRVRSRASLTTAVVIVAGTDALRATLADVYRALALPLALSTVGAVADQHSALDCARVQQAFLALAPDR